MNNNEFIDTLILSGRTNNINEWDRIKDYNINLYKLYKEFIKLKHVPESNIIIMIELMYNNNIDEDNMLYVCKYWNKLSSIFFIDEDDLSAWACERGVIINKIYKSNNTDFRTNLNNHDNFTQGYFCVKLGSRYFNLFSNGVLYNKDNNLERLTKVEYIEFVYDSNKYIIHRKYREREYKNSKDNLKIWVR